MADGRKRLSGSQYEKRRIEKIRRTQEVINSTRKIDNFFLLPKSTCQSSSNSKQQNTTVSTSTSEECSLVPSAASPEIGDSESSEIVDEEIYASLGTVALQPASAVPPELSPPEPSVSTTHDAQIETEILPSDPVDWKITSSDAMRDYAAIHGFQQNNDSDFAISKRQYPDQARYLTQSLFFRSLSNGEKISRCWLIYSKSTGRVFCGVCRLFRVDHVGPAIVESGFNDWKNAAARISEHENSPKHKTIVMTIKQRSNTLSRIDNALIQQMDKEISYWRNVLRRVVVAIIALVSRGLPFRGSDEKFGSVHNGNYMMLLEVIAEFDPFLAKHITECGNPGSGHTSYLSSTICNEFIEMMAKKVTKKIVEEIKSGKYFSIIVDSTPDISHVDQLSFIIRYIQEDKQPVERFITFVSNTGHKSEDLFNCVTETLNTFGLDLMNIRGQAYDNASNMAGVYTGLQARIKNLNPLAEFLPCSAHSLNLIGTAAAECCQNAVSFFSFLQELYNFFSASTSRWEVLLGEGSRSVKGLSQTRWSARSDACEALRKSWKQIFTALTKLSDDVQQKPVTRHIAAGLLREMSKLETCIMVEFWGRILKRMNAVNKELQSVDIDVSRVVDLYDSLIEFVAETRDNFTFYEDEALKVSLVTEYELDSDSKRKRRRKRFADEDLNEDVETPKCGSDHFRINVFFVILDHLKIELSRRSEVYKNLKTKFAAIFSLSSRLTTLEELQEYGKTIHSHYRNDLDDSLIDELHHLKAHLHSKECEDDKIKNGSVSPLQLSKWLHEQDLVSVYPNVDIALRMFICMPVANCSAERSFSALKRVKNYLR